MSKKDTIISLLKEIDANIDNIGGGNVSKLKVRTVQINNNCLDENGYWPAELFDTSDCTTLENSFSGATELKQLNVSNWNTSNVTSLRSTFGRCTNLEYVDVSNWDVSKVTDMYATFNGCVFKSLDFSKWDVSKVTNMNYFGASIALTFIGGRTIDEVLVDNIKCLNGLQIVFYVPKDLDRASLRALINGLADLTGSDAKVLSLDSSKLTEEDIAIATAKNWTIA